MVITSCKMLFQPTRPRGARPGEFLKRVLPFGFNPRAREGRDQPATICNVCYRRFNPRAREGRDVMLPYIMDMGILFQPTRPRGARHVTPGGDSSSISVSTHAPARGATATHYILKISHPCFNPRAREGRDLR